MIEVEQVFRGGQVNGHKRSCNTLILVMIGGPVMWFRVDLSALLGGIIGLILMLFVMMVFWFPMAMERLAPFLFP